MNKINKFLINEFKDFNWFEWLLFLGSTIGIVALGIIEKANLLAIFSGITGIWGVLFGAKGKISCFIFATIQQVLYIIIAFNQPGGEILLSAIILGLVFYIPINLFGYFSWFKKRDVQANVKPRKMSFLGILIALVVLILVYVGYSLILQFTSSNINQLWLDAMVLWTTVMAIILMVFRFIEQWALWILQDVILVIMWSVILGKGEQYATAVIMVPTYIIYTISALYGFVNWYRLESKNPVEPYLILDSLVKQKLTFAKKCQYYATMIFQANDDSKFLTWKHWKK